jgi:YggT family protein
VTLVLDNLAESVSVLVRMFFVILLLRAVASFFPAQRRGLWATLAWLAEILTEPVLAPIRSRLPLWGNLDLSPLVALVMAYLGGWILQELLWTIANHV